MSNTITLVVKQKRLRWLGHVTRRSPERHVKQAYRRDFPNPRLRGRPPKRWIHQVRQVRENTGLPIAHVERRASERGGWRRESCPERARGRRVLSI